MSIAVPVKFEDGRLQRFTPTDVQRFRDLGLGLFYVPIPITRRFTVSIPSMEWTIEHGMGTDMFSCVLRDGSGRQLYAPITIIDKDNFVVQFTCLTSGVIDIIFGAPNG